MREVFNLFEEKEKRALRVVGVLLGVAILFLSLISFPQKRSSIRAHSRLENKQSEYRYFNSMTLKKEDEWRQWQEASRDIDELKKSHFYSGNDAVKKMRLDIQRILNQARIPSTQKKYNYTEFKRENIKKMSVSFNVRGTYQSLKGLIRLVEEFPKFLIVEKIDFLEIDDRSSILELKIVLAGYYES